MQTKRAKHFSDQEVVPDTVLLETVQVSFLLFLSLSLSLFIFLFLQSTGQARTFQATGTEMNSDLQKYAAGSSQQ